LAAASKVALIVRSIAASPSIRKCYKAEGRQATVEAQSDEVIHARQAIKTQSTTTTNCLCICSMNPVLHLSGVTAIMLWVCYRQNSEELGIWDRLPCGSVTSGIRHPALDQALLHL